MTIRKSRFLLRSSYSFEKELLWGRMKGLAGGSHIRESGLSVSIVPFLLCQDEE